MTKYLLGIDNGGTMSKAALFQTDGTEVAVASRKIALIEPDPSISERDMLEMWEGTAVAVREVLDKSAVDPADIACIACTGHGNGLYLVDKEGNPVRNAINSSDSRAQAYVDKWMADGINEKVLPKTTQRLWPAQPNALLSWLRDNEPEVMKKADWVLMAKDYVRFRLTGNIAAELTDMSGCSLMNVVTGEYDDDVLKLFGILDMKRLLPPLVKTADICGRVTAVAADKTGLKEGTPVAGGMFDIDACGLASGIIDSRQMSLVSGTWGNNQYISKEPLVDKGLFMTSCYCIPGHYLMLEGSPTSAGNLEWFVSEFFQLEKEKAKQEGTSVFKQIDEMVASVDPTESDILFLPFLYGSNAGPAKSCFLGLQGWHKRAHVMRAIFEGVVFAHNTHVQRLLQFRDAPASIQFTGGAAKSDIWSQMFADCLGIPIEVPAGAELGSLGAAIAAGVACGVFDSYQTAVNSMVSFVRCHEPNENLKAIYGAKYERYRKAIDLLAPLW